MKKFIITGLLALVPSISLASIDTNLSFGSRGQAVVDLQNLLIGKGFLSSQASGNFYFLTKQAVIAYQTSVGLPTTGFVGPLTRQKINSETLGNTSADTQNHVGTIIASAQQSNSSQSGSSQNNVTSSGSVSAQNDAIPTSSSLQSQIDLLQQELVRLQKEQQGQASGSSSGTGVTSTMLDQLNRDLSVQSGQTVSLSNELVIANDLGLTLSDPAQYPNIINVLSQKIADLQAQQQSGANPMTDAQLQAVINSRNAWLNSATSQKDKIDILLQIVGQMAVAQGIDLAPKCSENPKLTFEPDRTTHSSIVTFLLGYETGCPLDKNTPWSLKGGNNFIYGSGTLSDGSWNFGKKNGSAADNIAFMNRSIETPSTNFVLTVGNTTATASVSAQ
jgi:peptidoglycan hydrolase-like protein with peptidoglycan-binding domain